ncbi:MAG: hypothetical protein ABF289_18620 [Clostridiales bacterium]
MLKISEFMKTIMQDILKVPLIDKTGHRKYGVSRQLFYNVITEKANLGKDGAIGFKDFVLDSIKKDENKKLQIHKYLNSLLSSKEKTLYDSKLNDTDNLTAIVISKFLAPEDSIADTIEFKFEIETNYTDFYVCKIKQLYKKILENYNDDDQIIIYCEKVKNLICKSFIKIEKIVQNNDAYLELLYKNNILPKHILIAIRNLENIISNMEEPTVNIINTKEYKEVCFANLKLLIKWYFTQYLDFSSEYQKLDDIARENEMKTNSEDKFKIVDINTLQEMGWTIKDYVEEATKLSFETVDELTEEHIVDMENSIAVISEQPENRRILLNEMNEMIGYWSFKTFYDDVFEKAKNGELFDSTIKKDMIPTMIAGIYNIYVSNICLKTRYRRTIVFRKMLFSIIDLFEEWANQEIYIKELCTQAYTDSGVNLCKSIGLKFYRHHIDHGDIYCGYIYDLVNQPFCKNNEKIKKLYSEFKNNVNF